MNSESIAFMNSTVTVKASDKEIAKADLLRWAHTHPKRHTSPDEFLADILAAVKVADYLDVNLEKIVQHIGERGDSGQVEQIMRLRFVNGDFILEKLNNETGEYTLEHRFDRQAVATIQQTPAVLMSRLPTGEPQESVFTAVIDGLVVTGMRKSVEGGIEFTVEHSITQEETASVPERVEGVLDDFTDVVPVAPIFTPLIGATGPQLKTGQDYIGNLEHIAQELKTGAPSTESMLAFLENEAGPNQGVRVLVYEEDTVDDAVRALAEKPGKKTFLRVVIVGKDAKGATMEERIERAISDQVGENVEIAQIAIALKGRENESTQERNIHGYLKKWQNEPNKMPSIVVLKQDSEDNLRLNMANMLLSILGNKPCFIGLGYDKTSFKSLRSFFDQIGGYFRAIEELSEGISEIFKAIRSTIIAV